MNMEFSQAAGGELMQLLNAASRSGLLARAAGPDVMLPVSSFEVSIPYARVEASQLPPKMEPAEAKQLLINFCILFMGIYSKPGAGAGGTYYCDPVDPQADSCIPRWATWFATVQNAIFEFNELQNGLYAQTLTPGQLEKMSDLCKLASDLRALLPPSEKELYELLKKPIEGDIATVLDAADSILEVLINDLNMPLYSTGATFLLSLRHLHRAKTREEVASFGALMLYTAAKSIPSLNAENTDISVATAAIGRRGVNLSDAYQDTRAGWTSITGAMAPRETPIRCINRAVQAYPAVKTTVFVNVIPLVGAIPTGVSAPYITILKLIENTGMAPYQIIMSLIMAFPFVLTMPELSAEVSFFRNSVDAYMEIPPHLQPFYKFLHTDATRIFHQKTLSRMTNLAVEVLKAATPSLERYAHSEEPQLLVAFKKAFDQVQALQAAHAAGMTPADYKKAEIEKLRLLVEAQKLTTAAAAAKAGL